ncbi:GNAT family N-acetyltransferase [Proteiniphilum sp. UBA1028]|jgi:diamine N-acetyltransferase|uniref:GNAT family N-acetyltransferase n=1 Tax=Proteiniphilum sp. UBA1028 TaxID=1947251 RepID=UPI000E985BDE|nr:GNAT family N-acetyltransferase [Proteiniphilum sp. UBA1028]HBG59039.1 GNAT family N-acetyltransferase [Porphyromonadaceae bacterium]
MEKLLENKEIRLRAPEPEDLELLYKWENDTGLWEYGNATAPYSRFSLKQYLTTSKQDIYADRQLRLMIGLMETEETIGMADLYDFDPFHRRAGVGILIDENRRNRGYGLQVLLLLEEYAFGFLSLHQLYAFIPEKNCASMRLFRNAGYYPAGKLYEWLSSGDIFEDVQVWQKIKQP